MSGFDRKPWTHLFFGPQADFYALLLKHAYKTLEGVEVLCTWFQDPQDTKAQRVRDLEKEADELKLDLQQKLDASFITPFDREDIFDLSMRLDEIINGAKAVVREVEALEISVATVYLQSMAELLAEGTRCLVRSCEHLNSNTAEAYNQAKLARKAESRFSKLYRQSMKELFDCNDLKTVLKTREVYRCLLDAAEKMDFAAEKLLFVIVKMR
jgi:uncharacterized protein